MEAYLTHIVPFLLATFRLAGTFLIAPIVASAAIPMQARVLTVFALGIAVYPSLPAWQMSADPPDLLTLAWGVIGETLIGFCIGLMMMMPVAAVQLSGLLMGQQMGFGLASVYNPAIETETDLIGDLLGYLALGIFLSLGGLEGTFVAVAKTFQHVPLGGFAASLAPVELITSMLGSGFDLATRVSLPLMGIILIETVATGFLTKTLPQANIMSIGFAVKIFLGFAAIIAGLRASDTAIYDHVAEVMQTVLRWSEHLGKGLEGGGVGFPTAPVPGIGSP